MSIALCRLGTFVPEKFPHNWQGQVLRYCKASISMSQIMNANIIELSSLSDQSPRLLYVYKLRTLPLAWEDIWIVRFALYVAKITPSFITKKYRLLARLGIRQMNLPLGKSTNVHSMFRTSLRRAPVICKTLMASMTGCDVQPFTSASAITFSKRSSSSGFK